MRSIVEGSNSADATSLRDGGAGILSAGLGWVARVVYQPTQNSSLGMRNSTLRLYVVPPRNLPLVGRARAERSSFSGLSPPDFEADYDAWQCSGTITTRPSPRIDASTNTRTLLWLAINLSVAPRHALGPMCLANVPWESAFYCHDRARDDDDNALTTTTPLTIANTLSTTTIEPASTLDT